MALLPIVEVPDARLRLISQPVEAVDAAVRRLADDMLETMYDAPGIGLAAIQIGQPLRMLVIDLQPETEGVHQRRPGVFINPELVETSAETSVYSEGCLSIPDMYADVTRPARVRARWQDVDGAIHEAWLDGLMATCLQHEIDHLNGVLFIDHISRLKREMLLRKLEKARREKAAA